MLINTIFMDATLSVLTFSRRRRADFDNTKGISVTKVSPAKLPRRSRREVLPVDAHKPDIREVAPLAVEPIQILNMRPTDINQLIFQSLSFIFIHRPLQFTQKLILRVT